MWKKPEVYQDEAKNYRWRIERDKFEDEKENIYSPESYKTKTAARKNLEAVSKVVVASTLGLRPSVVGFAVEMERQLREHDEVKGDIGWLSSQPLALLAKLIEEAGEVAELIMQREVQPDEVRKECADVGNIAMMIADRLAGFPCT